MNVCALYRRAFSSVTQAVLSKPGRSLAASAIPTGQVNIMKKVQLGNSDLQVSVACLGTMVRAPPLTALWMHTTYLHWLLLAYDRT